ncbi:MAG: histidine phosphatase family protein [Pseudonocardiaceae bacterium]
MRLVLARHGQTGANVRGALDTGLPGYPLTDEGHRQAAELAERLATEPVVAVYASHAVRAQQTARPVAVAHGLDVALLDGVHEAFAGDLEGSDDLEQRGLWQDVYRAWHTGELDRAVPGGESGEQVLRRYLADVDRVRVTHPHGTVVLVSHGAALRLAACALAPNVEGAFAWVHYLPNTATVLLERDGATAGWRSLRWHDVDLPAAR